MDGNSGLKDHSRLGYDEKIASSGSSSVSVGGLITNCTYCGGEAKADEPHYCNGRKETVKKVVEQVMKEHEGTLKKLAEEEIKEVYTETKGGATRANINKLRWRNFPMFLIRPLIKVAAAGEKKYGTFNFLKGLTVNDCLDSMKRHLDAYEDPAQSDYDDGPGGTQTNHLANLAWNALVACYMQELDPKKYDDRWKPEE